MDEDNGKEGNRNPTAAQSETKIMRISRQAEEQEAEGKKMFYAGDWDSARYWYENALHFYEGLGRRDDAKRCRNRLAELANRQ